MGSLSCKPGFNKMFLVLRLVSRVRIIRKKAVSLATLQSFFAVNQAITRSMIKWNLSQNNARQKSPVDDLPEEMLEDTMVFKSKHNV